MTVDETTAVIVVSYGSAKLLAQNLVQTVESASARVIVVENHQGRLERESTRALGLRHGWTVLEPPENLGFGGGNNLAARTAIEFGCNALVLLNPDLALSTPSLERLVQLVHAAPDAMMAPAINRPDGRPYTRGPIVVDLDHSIMVSHEERDRRPAMRSMEWLSGACLALSADLWQRVGGFDDAYFLYWEDVDISRRILAAGGHLRYEGSVQALHDEGATHRSAHGERVKSETYYYYNIRNRYVFAARWTPRRRFSPRFWLATPRAVLSVLLQGGRRQFITSLSPWRATARGLTHGMPLLWRLEPSPFFEAYDPAWDSRFAKGS